MAEANRISTFIANRNHGKFLRKAADSILGQTVPPYELLLLDDASTDDSPEVMEEIEKTNKGTTKIKVRLRAHHDGHIYLYKKGILWSTGELIHLMAADDMVDSTFYEKALPYFDDPRVAMVFAGLRRIDENSYFANGVVLPDVEGPKDAKFWLLELQKRGNFICGACVLIRRSVQMEIGAYEPSLPYSADFMNWIKVFKAGYSAAAINEPLYAYRIHRGQMTHRDGAPNQERAACLYALEEAIRHVL